MGSNFVPGTMISVSQIYFPFVFTAIGRKLCFSSFCKRGSTEGHLLLFLQVPIEHLNRALYAGWLLSIFSPICFNPLLHSVFPTLTLSYLRVFTVALVAIDFVLSPITGYHAPLRLWVPRTFRITLFLISSLMFIPISGLLLDRAHTPHMLLEISTCSVVATIPLSVIYILRWLFPFSTNQLTFICTLVFSI